MRMRLFAVALAIGLIAGQAKAADGPYKLIKDVEIGGEGGWDYLTVDAATYRIYLAAAKYQDPPAGSPATARPTIIPGSMHLLIYGIDGK